MTDYIIYVLLGSRTEYLMVDIFFFFFFPFLVVVVFIVTTVFLVMVIRF